MKNTFNHLEQTHILKACVAPEDSHTVEEMVGDNWAREGPLVSHHDENNSCL